MAEWDGFKVLSLPGDESMPAPRRDRLSANEAGLARHVALSPDEQAESGAAWEEGRSSRELDMAISDAQRKGDSKALAALMDARDGANPFTDAPHGVNPRRNDQWAGFKVLSRPKGADLSPDALKKTASGDYFDAIGKGVSNLGTSLQSATWMMTGKGTPEIAKALAEQIANNNASAGEREIQDATKAANDAKGGWDTAKSIGNLLWSFASNPYDAGKMVVEQLPNAVPSMIMGAAGAAAGSVAGPAGTLAGGLGGLGAGSAAVEFGAKLSDKVGEALAGKQPTPENIQAILERPGFREAAMQEGRDKGITVGAIDALSAVVGGRIATSPFRAAAKKALAREGVDLADTAAVNAALKTAPMQAAIKAEMAAISTGRKVGMGAAGVAVDSTMEGGGEYLGEYAAAGQGKLGDAILEGVTSLGQSTAEVAGSAAFQRSRGMIGGTAEAPAAEQRKQAVADIATAPNVDAAIEAFNRATKPGEPAVDFSADETAAIQRHAKQRLAELERITLGSKGGQSIDVDGQMVKMPDQMGRFFTPEEKQEYDFLRRNGGDLKAIAQAYGFKPAGGLEYDRLGALGMINAAPAAAPEMVGPEYPLGDTNAIPYDYSIRQNRFAALPAPESPTNSGVLINDTDPELTRPEQMGDRETRINATQRAREEEADAPGVRDIVQTPEGPRRRARVTLDEAGNIIDAPDGDRQFLSLVRREARPHAAAAIEAHSINPTLTEAVLAAPNMGPKAERTVFEAITNGTLQSPEAQSVIARFGLPGRTDANGQGQIPLNPAAPGQQPNTGSERGNAEAGIPGTGAAAAIDNRNQGVAPPVPRPLTVKTDAELRLQAKNTRVPDELKAISDELARRKMQASTEAKQGGVGPAEVTDITAWKAQSKARQQEWASMKDRYATLMTQGRVGPADNQAILDAQKGAPKDTLTDEALFKVSRIIADIEKRQAPGNAQQPTAPVAAPAPAANDVPPKTKTRAKLDAQKLEPVTKVGGKLISDTKLPELRRIVARTKVAKVRDAVQAEIKRREELRAASQSPEARLKRAQDKSRKGVWRAIVAAGGISEKEAADLNIDPRSLGGYRMSGLITKNGMRSDILAEFLFNEGYLSESDMQDGGDGAARQFVQDMLAGEFVGNAEQANEYHALLSENHDEAAIEASGFDDAPIEVQAEVADFDVDFGGKSNVTEDEFLAALGADEQEVEDARKPRSGEGSGEVAADQGRTRQTGRDEPAGPQDRAAPGRGEVSQEPAFALDSQTSEDLAAQARAAEEAQAAADKAAKAKDEAERQERVRKEIAARSVAAAGEFQLGQTQAEAEATLAGQGDIFSQPAAKPEKPKGDTDASLDRSRPREFMAFSKPYEGATGAKLVGYEWAQRKEEYIDKRGENRTRRVSDWDQAVKNLQTGRDVVHQFHITTKDGESHVVSAETAATMLSVAQSTVRTNAVRLLQQEIEARKKQEADDKRVAELDAMESFPTPAAAIESRKPDGYIARVVDRALTEGKTWGSADSDAPGREKYRFLKRDGKFIFSPELVTDGSALHAAGWRTVDLRANEIWNKNGQDKTVAFQKMIADQKADRARLEAKLERLFLRDGGVRATRNDSKTGQYILLTAGTTEAPYRVTSIDDEGPSGHRDYNSIAEAANEFAHSVTIVDGPAPRAKAVVTPQVASAGMLKTFIGIAADSIEQLRKVDVERVLTSNPKIYQATIAQHIKEKRPDLADEVDAVLEEAAPAQEKGAAEPKAESVSRETPKDEPLASRSAPTEAVADMFGYTDADEDALLLDMDAQERAEYEKSKPRGMSWLDHAKQQYARIKGDYRSLKAKPFVSATYGADLPWQESARNRDGDALRALRSEAVRLEKDAPARLYINQDGTARITVFDARDVPKRMLAFAERNNLKTDVVVSGAMLQAGNAMPEANRASGAKYAVEMATPDAKNPFASRPGYTAPYRDLDAARFTVKTSKTGMPVYLSRTMALSNAREKDAFGVPKGGRALAFDIFDRRMKDANGMARKVGMVLAHQDADGKFVSLRNIQIDPKYRERGYYHGEGVIAGMLLHNGTTPMEVFNIQSAAKGDEDNALPFWKTIGTTILNNSSDPDVIIEGNISLARYMSAGEKRANYGQSSRDSREQPISRRDEARVGESNARRVGGDQGRGSRTGRVDAVRAELTDAFGEAGVAALEREGILQITTWDNAPKNLTDQLQSGDHGAYWPSRKTAYIFADNLAPGQAVEVLLHEIGEHYGLKEMLGDRYDRTVAQVKTLHKAGNKAIVAAWKHVERNYDLEPGSPVFMQEVIAKAGQSADVRKMAWWQRLIADIKAFLIKVGLKNVTSERDLGIMLRASVQRAMRQADGPVSVNAGDAMASRLSDQLRGMNKDADKGLFEGDIDGLLQERGESVATIMDAERRFNDGERIFIAHDMGDTPTEITSTTQLKGYTADQLIALPVDDAPMASRNQTSTPAFKNWFGDSKIVDANGRPLVVYHRSGPQADFESFVPHKPKTVYRAGDQELIEAMSWDMGNDGQGAPDAYHYMAISDAAFMGAEKALEIRRAEAKTSTHPDTLRLLRDLERLQGKDVVRSTEVRPSGDGSYFTPDPGYSFIRQPGAGAVYPVYLRIENPLYLNSSQIEGAGLDFNVEKYRAMGYDGAIFRSDPTDLTRAKWGEFTQIVIFDGNQAKSAISNNGNFDPNEPGIMASRPGTIGATWDMLQSAKTPAQARALAMNLFDNPNKFNLWDKTIGTQLTKARKNEYFRAVFDALQAQQDSTAAYAIEAEAEAADVLARMEGMGEIKSALKSTFTGLKFEKGSILPQGERARDLQAVSKAIFSNIEGEQGVKQKVFTDAELAKDFGLNDRQIALYRQSRAAIDRSLDRYAQSLAIRMAQKFVYTGDLHRAGLDDTVEALTERMRLQRQVLEDQKEPEQSVEDMEARLAELEEMRDAAPREILRSLQTGPDGETRQEYASMPDTAAATALDREIRDLKRAIRSGDDFNPANRELDAKIEALDAALSKLPEIAEQANSLKDKGYAPAMRFGDYAVTATQGGETVFFTMVDTKTQANLLKMRLAREMPGAELRVNPVDRESFKLFGGVDPATVELFARFMEVEENDAFKAYIALATSSRSALKHMLERKGIAGFSDNLPRVMAAFITSNSRAAARNIHGFDVNAATEATQKNARGDVSEEAAKLVNYMNNPTGDFAKVRGFMFAYFMGGSVSSALVNLTQPLMMTTPYLEQFAGKKIAGIMVRASKAAATGKVEGPMKAALARAEAEGITDAHEYHQLMQEAEGGGLVATRALMKSWGSMFGAAERFNRRITFLAAFETGQGMTREELSKQGVGDAYEFAKQAVVETQGLYNRANRPNWARNPVGALAMTFKQFSIAWVEFFIRLPRKQQLMALGLLILMAGIEGLPFAEDLEDLIDTIGQRMGRGTNSKKALRQAATNILGETGAQFALHGISGLAGMPMDVAGRLGMGNLIPGTKLLNPSIKDKGREALEIVGPAGGLAQKAAGILDGNVKEAMPKAFADAAKAWEMLQTGEYRDTRGRKVMDVDGMDSLMKMIGFQPRDVAANTRFIGENMRDVDTVKRIESEIAEQWADGIRNKDVEESRAARERLQRWNAENPDLPIKITFAQVLRRARQASLTRDERFMKTAPPELRRRMLAEAVQ